MTDEALGGRVDRLETLMERVERQIAENSQQIAENSQQIAENSRQIAETSQASAENTRNIDRVVNAIEALYELNQAQRLEFIEFQRTTQAALDRIDRVMDYLMRRDGQQPG